MNTITFGGVLSSTYDIYISGEGVWSAPARDAEMVKIPGRNGAFVHDKERFENIEVTYPAFIVKDNNTNFATKIDGFRNAMSALVGYQKLVDTFHTDEYRMAAFIGGMEIKPILYNDHAATFDIVFNCKPQRFLTTGDTAVAVANNGTITNPTLFDAKPQLQVWGYGNIDVNGYSIKVNNAVLGDILLHPADSSIDEIRSRTIDGLMNTNDMIYCNKVKGIVIKSRGDFSPKVVASILRGTATVTTSGMSYTSVSYAYIPLPSTPIKDRFDMIINGISFAYDANPHSLEMKIPVIYTFTDSSTQTVNICLKIYAIGVPGVDPYYLISYTSSVDSGNTYSAEYVSMEELRGNSTKSALGTPTYIDCDIGESYLISGGEPVSLDHLIELGSKLPVLSSGANTVTYDNTVTLFKILPRWWKI